MQLDLHDLQGSSITEALHGIANFDKNSSNYPHTIFRLPLRTEPSKLSKNIYSVEKLKRLLDALKQEAKYLLLFLKSVTKIEVLYINKHSGRQEQTFCVSVDSSKLHQINSERSRLLARLHEVHNAKSCQVSNTILSKTAFKIKVTDKGQSDTSEWVVVTQVGSRNETVLQTAEELSIFPWVGAAAELSSSQTDSGRVFCFLPLPPEVTSGLPVHVNGTFSLNDERRTLKWTSAERTNDIMATWNDLLVTNLLPECYYHLLLLVRDMYGHEQFYRSWPDRSELEGSHWIGLLQDLYRYLFSDRCVWSTESGCWVRIQNAIFIKQGDPLSSVITRVLTKCDSIVVQAPDIFWRALKFSGEAVTIITPSLTRREIRNDKETYRSESTEDKLKLLQFCLLDEEFSDLYNIALVPLANGKFTTFASSWSSSPKYVCSSEHPLSLIPNQNNLLIDVSNSSLQDALIELAVSETTQLKTLNTKRVAALLPDSFPEHWRGKSLVTLPCPGFPAEWFEIFWNWVQSRDLSHFIGLPVLPIATKSMRDSFSVTRLNEAHQSSVLVVSEDCPREMLTALEKLKVMCTMIRHTPYVKHPKLSQYVNKSSYPGQILTAINNSMVNPSNISFSEAEAMSLQQYLATKRAYLNPTQQTALKKLSVFRVLNSSQLVSIETANVLSGRYQATVQPPGVQLSAAYLPDMLKIFSRDENYLLLFDYFTIDKPRSMCELIQTKVFPMIRDNCISSSEIDALMKEVLQLLPALIKQTFVKETIIVSIKRLSFLPTLSGHRKAPADLFDPTNKELISLFQGDEDVFPLSPFDEREYILPLRECGLQTSVSAQQLFNILNFVSLVKSNFPVESSEQAFSRVEAVLDYISLYPVLLSRSVIRNLYKLLSGFGSSY